MNAVFVQAAYRIKAVLAGTFIALVGVAEWLVNNPDTATAIQQVVPEPWAQFVPVVLGAVGTVLVHQIPLGAKPVKADDSPPETGELADTFATTIIPTQTGN